MIDWFNQNSGFVSVLIFIVTLLVGWITGIFKALQRKPKFKIEIIPGPTLCSVLFTGKKYQGYDVHRTAISLYLKISNIGYAPSNIDRIEVGYHWNINQLNWLWFKYRLGWFWIRQQTVAMTDFHVALGDENFKFYPFLFQKSIVVPSDINTYLEIGNKIIGIVYFEGEEQWGGAFPLNDGKVTKVKIRAYDIFGNTYTVTKKIPFVDILEAKKFNPSFGETFLELAKKSEESEFTQ